MRGLRLTRILISVVGVSSILTACGSTRELETLRAAAVEKAVAEAPTKLPEAPAYCTDDMPTVVPALNEPVWGTQERWRVVRSNELDRDAWCWNVWYKGVIDHAAGVVPPKR